VNEYCVGAGGILLTVGNVLMAQGDGAARKGFEPGLGEFVCPQVEGLGQLGQAQDFFTINQPNGDSENR